MGRTATIFIMICMGVIALSAAAVLIFQFGRPFGEAVSLGLALMCTMILSHVLLTRAQDRSSVSEAVDRLEDRMADLDEDLENLEGRLTGVEHNIPRRTRLEIDPLFAEVEVLGTLVKQMAEAMSDLETRVEEQEALPPQAHQSLPHYQSQQPAPPSPRGLPHPHYPAQSEQHTYPHSQPADGRYSRYEPPETRPHPQAAQQAQYAAHEELHTRNEPTRRAPEPVVSPPYERNSAPEHARAAPPVRVPEPLDDSDFPMEHTIAEVPPAVEEPQPDPAMRELIRSALNANRVELHLQPIVTLPQRQVKYYEAFTKLRDADGAMISAATFMPEAVRSGLAPRIDNLLLFRSVQVMRRLTSRNRKAALFCNISSLSLVDETFFPGFLEFVNANRNFSETLVFEFTQSDVAAMGAVEMESVDALSELGFYFSVDQVDNLKMDFKALAQRGFKYAKLHADYLIGRRAVHHGHIHPADFGDLLHRYGMELVTDHVETENQVLELLDFDIKLAQGNLFSPPRPVRAEVLQGTPAPAPKTRAAGTA